MTFTSPASRLPGWTGLPDPAAAAAAAIPAYLGAHGPAGPAAFDQWLCRGASRKAALRSWFAALVEEGVLSTVIVDGETLLARTADLDALSSATPTTRVRLLPAFDQYVLGPGTKDAHVLDPARRAAVSRAAGWISPVVVAGGRVTGTWEVDGDALAVELFCTVDRTALDAELDALQRVLGRRLTPASPPGRPGSRSAAGPDLHHYTRSWTVRDGREVCAAGVRRCRAGGSSVVAAVFVRRPPSRAG